jgi:hypothetical protein
MVTLLIFAIFGALLLVCVARPHLVLAPALCLYAFEQWAQVNSGFFRSHPSALNFGFGALCLAAIAALIVRGENPFRHMGTSSVLLGLLYFLALASSVWSLDPNLSFYLWKYSFPNVVTFALMVPLCVRRERELKEGLIFALVCGTITLLLVYFGTRVHAWGRTIEMESAMVIRGGETRSRLSPLAVAELGGQILILTSLLNFTGVLKVWKPARWPVALLAVLNIVRSGSRGQLIGSLFSVAWFVGGSRGYNKQFQLVVGLVTFLLIVVLTVWSFSLAGIDNLAKRWELSSMGRDLSETRLALCMEVINVWAKMGPVRWLIGMGSNASFSPQVLGVYPHVLVVEVMVELGILGLALLLGCWACAALDLRTWWLIVKDNPSRRGLASAMAGLLLFAISLTFKQGTFMAHTYMMMLTVVVARVAVDVRTQALVERQQQVKRRLALTLIQLRGRAPAPVRETAPAT